MLSVGLIPENELSRSMGVDLSGITSGATVDQDRQTSIEGVFACGNVLHVHDLVDFVSEEAEIAGKAAAEYINGAEQTDVNIPIKTDGKIRYTVPQVITKSKDVTVFFRVSDVYKNVKITVKSGDDVIVSKKKVRVAPGEMESIKLRACNIEKRKELIFSLEVV